MRLRQPTKAWAFVLQKTAQDRYRETHHAVTAAPGAILSPHESHRLNQDERMKSANELLQLFARQAELEKAMRQPGGARITEEQELLAVRRKLAEFPEAMGTSSPMR
jgi:hypothetical protein